MFRVVLARFLDFGGRACGVNQSVERSLQRSYKGKLTIIYSQIIDCLIPGSVQSS
jgi:hypothetical protein